MQRITIWGELVLGSQNNTPDETASTMLSVVSCYKPWLVYLLAML